MAADRRRRLPGLRGSVPRYTRLRYEGVDQYGNAIRRDVDGFHARVVQHECDHLDGVLYVDRLGDGDWKTAQKIARKRGWGRPGASWMPGIDDIDA